MQLEAIASCPIASYLGEETNTHLTTTSFQVVVESNKVSPQPPLLQTKQPQLPQLLLIRLVLQALHKLLCPSLDTLQQLCSLLVVRGPKLNTVFEEWPHQCWVQGDNHFPAPAGYAIPDTSLDAVGLLGLLGTLLAHVQPAVNQHPQDLYITVMSGTSSSAIAQFDLRMVIKTDYLVETYFLAPKSEKKIKITRIIIKWLLYSWPLFTFLFQNVTFSWKRS